MGYVLKKCEAWFNEAGISFVAIDDVRRTTPAVAPHVASLDFIVLRGDEKLLVTLRPNLQAKHLASIAELQKLFGADYRTVRIWPAEGQTRRATKRHREKIRRGAVALRQPKRCETRNCTQ